MTPRWLILLTLGTLLAYALAEGNYPASAFFAAALVAGVLNGEEAR